MPDALPPKEVDDFFGYSTLVEDDPLCVLHRDVLCVPMGTPGSSPGLFDRGRKAITAAADYRATPHPESNLDSFTALDPEAYSFADDGYDYVFVGAVTGHYGHFITASMSRLWCARLVPDPRTRYVILNPPPAQAFFDIEFIAMILGTLGITPENTVSVRRPTRFARITVPSPAFEEHNFSHRVFGGLCARIGDMLVPERHATNDTPVFLSKAKLRSGVARIANEDELCAYLEQAGVEVVYPETLPLDEQVSLFRSRRYVTGFAGSGLHTGIFTPDRDRIALSVTPQLLTNQLLLDQCSGSTTATYLVDAQREAPGKGWDHAFRLASPEATAAMLVERIEQELRPRVERRALPHAARRKAAQRTVGSFVFEDANAAALAGQEGWWAMEGKHCWAAGATSTLQVRVTPTTGELTLEMEMGAALALPHLVSRPVTVFARGILVGSFVVDRTATFRCALPRACLSGDVVHLRFDHPVKAAPRDLGEFQDDREMSILFKEVRVTEAASA